MTLGGDDGNVELLGDYIAWLIANSLVSDTLERSASTAVTRVRMQDLTGAEFLSTILFGELTSDHLTEEGQRFTAHYLVSGKFADECSGVPLDEDDWYRYTLIAPKITAAWQAYRQKGKRPSWSAKILKFPGR